MHAPGEGAASTTSTGLDHAVDMVMTSSENTGERTTRADLLPEERVAGSDDPQAQAEEILAESDERTEQSGPASAP
jgi:hypothetical protein